MNKQALRFLSVIRGGSFGAFCLGGLAYGGRTDSFGSRDGYFAGEGI